MENIPLHGEALALATGTTYGAVTSTGVTAHPIKRPYPTGDARFVIPIAKGGAIEWVYEVKGELCCRPEDLAQRAAGLPARWADALTAYNRRRIVAFGGVESAYRAGLDYRFYLMERVAAIESPTHRKYVQVSARMSLDEMRLTPVAGDEEEALSLTSVLEPAAEGGKTLCYTTRYERDPKNRELAIRAHGLKCQACGFDFEEAYGELGRGFIEVHHVKPLHSLGGETPVDPVEDLVCLCSNCHRMVHRKKGEVLSVEELSALLGKIDASKGGL